MYGPPLCVGPEGGGGGGRRQAEGSIPYGFQASLTSSTEINVALSSSLSLCLGVGVQFVSDPSGSSCACHSQASPPSD